MGCTQVTWYFRSFIGITNFSYVTITCVTKNIYKYMCIIIYFCGLKHRNLYDKLYDDDDVAKNTCHAFTHSRTVAAMRPDSWIDTD